MRLSRLSRWLLALVFGCTVVASKDAFAQDLRGVVEPRIPPICTVLTAELTPHNGTLPDSVERHYRDTSRIEKAMRHCQPGSAVVLRAGEEGHTVFLIGPTRMSANVTIVVEANVAVWASRDPRNYDVSANSCASLASQPATGSHPATGSQPATGCKPLFAAQDAAHAAIMGDGVIDGRGGARLLLPDGKEGETWWELARRARAQDAISNLPSLLSVRRSNDFTLYRITLRDGPGSHVTTEATDGFTAWGLKVDAPRWARNTDGIDPLGGSTNVSIIDSFLRTGGDGVSPEAPEGAPVTHLTVRNTHFYTGQGFGIGVQTAGGVAHVLVTGVSMDGADHGFRIQSDRSRGGLVDDISLDSVCMRGVAYPVVITPIYAALDGNKLPVYRDIKLRNVHALAAAGVSPNVVLAGVDAGHRLEASLDNVVIDGVKAASLSARHATLTIKRGNLEPGGEDVRTTGSDGGGTALACAGAFPNFPQESAAPQSAEIIPAADTTFYVAADGTGDFTSVQAAVDKVPAAGGVIVLAPGVYRERVLVRQAHVTLRSANPDASRTVLVSDSSRVKAAVPAAGQAAVPAGSGAGTAASALGGAATLTVRGSDFHMENVTVQNDFARLDAASQLSADAQALRLVSDRSVLRNVRLLGGQHTAYFGALECAGASRNPCEAGRTLVVNSFVAGNLEVLYGDGEVFFEGGEIRSLPHAPLPSAQGAQGFLTAQGKHYPGQASEFVFRNTRLTAEPGVSDVYLGQPWREFATVIFLSPQVGGHIAPAGFRERQPAGLARMQTATFRIFNAKGPGAPTLMRALTAAEAAHYTPREVLAGKDGWVPE